MRISYAAAVTQARFLTEYHGTIGLSCEDPRFDTAVRFVFRSDYPGQFSITLTQEGRRIGVLEHPARGENTLTDQGTRILFSLLLRTILEFIDSFLVNDNQDSGCTRMITGKIITSDSLVWYSILDVLNVQQPSA